MKEENEVNMKEAADNVILLDEAVFERIVHVLVKVLQSNDYPEERRTILNAIDYAQRREEYELKEQYMKQQAVMQQATKMWVSGNTGSVLQNTLNSYANTASTQSIQDQLTPSILDEFKFW